MPKANKWKITSAIVAFIPLLVILLCGYLNGKKYDQAIRENSSLTVGKVYGYEHINKHSPVLKYEFSFDGIVYYSTSSNSTTNWLHWEDTYKTKFPKINRKTFPVYFSKDAPNKYNKILVTPEDFSEFNIGFPDSLNWVKTLLK